MSNPDMVNGYPVITSEALPERAGCQQSRVIIVDRGESTFQRYVSAQQNIGDTEWYWGHYTDSLSTAIDVANDRFKRAAAQARDES